MPDSSKPPKDLSFTEKSNPIISSSHTHRKDKLTLIMKGGGVKGIAYVGALEELNKYYKFNWFAGTSAGAISALLLASGYTTEELKEDLEKDFTIFKDASFFRRIWNFCTKGGLHEAITFKEWIQELLGKKLKIYDEVLLEDLPYRVTVYASRRRKEALVFDSNTDKKVSAAHAARCSMAIPLIFTPEKDQGLNVFDGGTQNNYPVEKLLKDNPNTNFIGLYLGPRVFNDYKKKNIICELLSIWTESMDYVALKNYRAHTIVIDPSPISTLDFNLSEQEKEFLLECGRVYAREYLSRKGKSGIDYNFKIEEQALEKKREVLIKQRKKHKNSIWKKLIPISLSIIIIFSSILIYEDCQNTTRRKDGLIHEKVRKDKIDIINKVGLKVYRLIQVDNNKCQISDFPDNDNCYPKGYAKVPNSWDNFKAFTDFNNIYTDEINGNNELLNILETKDSIQSDSILLTFCFKDKKSNINMIGVKLTVSYSYWKETLFSFPILDENWHRLNEGSGYDWEFIYKKELKNDCIEFTILK